MYPVYGGDNYDLSDSWNTLETQWTKPVVDNEAGTLTTSFSGTRNWIWVQTNDNWDNSFHVKYTPGSDHVVQMRVKFENMKVTDGATPNFQLLYYHTPTRMDGTEAERLCYCDSKPITDTSLITGGQWVTLTFPITGVDSAMHVMSSLRFQFAKIESESSSVKGSVTFDYIYVGSEADAPANKDYLYFDFQNTPEDQKRYDEHPVYSGVNYDITGSWSAFAEEYNAPVVDNETGTLSVSYKGTRDFIWVQTSHSTENGFSLNYQPKDDHVVKVRVKFNDMVVTSGKKPYFEVAYFVGADRYEGGTANPDAEKIYYFDRNEFASEYVTLDGYVVLTFPLTGLDSSAHTKLTNLRFLFANVESASSAVKGSVTVDYIYVGREEDFTKGLGISGGSWQTLDEVPDVNSYLFFGMNNTTADQQRYASNPAYGGYNYDNGTWCGRGYTLNAPKFDNLDGTVSFTTKAGYSGANGYSYYIQPSGAVGKNFYLQYDPAEAEYAYLRVKLENFISNGTPGIRLAYYLGDDCDAVDGDNDTDELYNLSYRVPIPYAYLTTEEYFLVKIPVTELREHERISTFRISFLDVKDNGSEQGVITLDYFFVGKEEDFEKVLAIYEGKRQSVLQKEYQDQIDIVPTGVHKTTATSELSTSASETEVLESLGVTNTLSAGHAQRNEYYGLTNGKSKYQNNIPSSIAHRGSFRTSSENSYVGIMDALKLGVDNVEIDLMITSDGVVVLCHDDTADRTMNKSGVSISDITWNELKDFPLEIANGVGDVIYYTLTAEEAAMLNNSIPNYTAHYGEAATAGGNHYTVRFDDLLDLLKNEAPNAMLTLDKITTQEKFVAVFKLLYDKGMVDQAMFSMNTSALSNLNTWADAAATACGITQAEVKNSILVRYSVGLSTGTVANLQKQLNNGSYVKVVEYTYTEADAAKAEEYLTTTLIPFMKANNIGFYPSAIGPGWAGGRDDEETTWLHYLNMGADAIMTDRAEELAGFMYYYNGGKRNSTELIEAEHFQNYNADTAQFYMKEAADLNNNKLVNEMHSGDWLQYNNITFTGSETTLYVTAKGHAGGKLRFYADSMTDADNCFAVVEVYASESGYTQSVTMLKKLAKGTHTVYVKAEGVSGTALLSFDAFSCANFTNSNYLYFGFGNTEADKARYQNDSAYGGYNFDTAYWGTNSTTGNNSTAQNRFSIDNQNGVAVINVGTASNGTDPDGTTLTYGPEFMTSNTSGVFPWNGRADYAPLKYTPSKSDFLTVRFKISGCVDSGINQIFFEFWYTDAYGNSKISYYQGEQEQVKADYTFVQDEYITVTIALPQIYEQAAQINSIGLRFVGVKPADSDGKITIDYIYVGPMPDQQTDHLLIGFDGDAEAYDDPIYGGKNYDLASSWSYNSGRSTAPEIADGVMKYSVLTTCGVTYHRMVSDYRLRYVPGKDEYIQIRLRAENATAVTGKTPTLNFYWSPDAYSRTSKGTGNRNNTSATIDLSTTDWQTISIRLDTSGNSAYYRDAEVIGSLCVMFNNVAVSEDESARTTFYIDYIYVGPLEDAPSEKANETQTLFFDFTDTALDRARYTEPQYGGIYNYDAEVKANWATHATAKDESSNMINFTIDNEAGTAAVTVGDDAEGENTYGPKFQTSKAYGIYPWNNAERHAYAPLNFIPTGEEYLQVRFKIEGCEVVGSTKLQLDYHFEPVNGSTYMKYAGVDQAFTFLEGEYLTVTASLKNAAAWKTSDVIQSIGLRFTGIKSKDPNNLGHVTIDYIYVGPENGLPTSTTATMTTAARAKQTYGYDSSYTEDSQLSNASSLYVEGMGVPNVNTNKTVNYADAAAYTEASFTFTGTGFDIISRTGANQGMLRVLVLDAGGKVVKSATVLNKSDFGSEFYQIPVLSIEGLEHGTYTAKIFVGAAYDYGNDGNADILGGSLDRGGEFYFDAVRIHNPINTAADAADAKTAYEIYQKHGEADAVITEVRNMLITADSFNAGGTMEGVAYLDAKSNSDKTVLENYTEIGPNNEVYLSAGKAIAFKLEVTGTIPASVDIGIKSADGTGVSALMTVSKSAPTALPTGTDTAVASSTSQYYPLNILPSQWTTSSGKSSVYVTICHNGDSGILSITDIKCAYDCPNPTAATEKSVRFLVDADMISEVDACTEHIYTYADQGKEHKATCANCDYSLTEGHNFVGGTCLCGAKEVVEPKYEYNSNLGMTMNISVGAEMQVMYTVLNARVKSYESFYVEVLKDVVGGESVKTVFSLNNGNMDEIFAPNGNLVGYSATYTGIFAMEMGDNFTATLYAVAADGTIYYGESESSSIKTYLMEKLADESTLAELKTLAVDMLNYGAAAQVNFNYDAENLVNADLTDEQKLLGTQEIPSATDSSVTNGDGGRITTSVSLQSKVLLYVNCNYAKTENSNLEFVVKNLNGDVLERFAPTLAIAKLCQGVYGNVGARQMRDLITIELYDNGVLVSQTLTWNIESYVAQTREASASSDALISTVNAMLAYGDSAAVYLTASGQ